MSNAVTLTVTGGPSRGKIFVFEEHDTFLFGRSGDCHVQLPVADTTASRHHFIMEVNPPNACIRDLGSRNGTYVNGVRFGGRRRDESPEEASRRRFPAVDLHDSDVVRVGESVIEVSVTVSEDASTDAATTQESNVDTVRVAAAESDALSFPGYDVESILGEGGMGIVYLARSQADGTRVAIKVMRAKVAVSAKARDAFRREIEVTRTLRHPHCVELLEHRSIDSAFYFVMEYCPGGSLADLSHRRGGTLPLDVAAPIFLESLDGLAFAHAQGFVHRDIKPHNILLMEKEGGGAKVSDFGLAKSFEKAGLSGMTATNARAGTLAFMPKEQLTMFRYVKPASDVWSIAATFYYVLTGAYTRDFLSGEDPLHVILGEPIVPIRQRDPNVPLAIAALIDRALGDDPEARPANAGELRDAFARVL